MPLPLDSRWTRAVRRIFNLHTDPPLSDVLSPTFDLSNDCAEWYFARDERLLATPPKTVAAGGAGNFSRLRVSNHASSGLNAPVRFWNAARSAATSSARRASEPLETAFS